MWCRHDATASVLTRALLAGLVGTWLPPAAPPRRPHHCRPQRGKGPATCSAVQSVAACVCASEWCAVVQELSIRGKGWGTCSSSPVTSKPTPMGTAQGPGVRWTATRVSCIRQRSQDKIGEYLLLYLHLSRDQSLPFRGAKLASWLRAWSRRRSCSGGIPL